MVHLVVTLAVALATAAHYVLSTFAPDMAWASPLASLLSNLLWIWTEE